MGHFRQHLLGENLSDVQQEEGAGGENGEDIRHGLRIVNAHNAEKPRQNQGEGDQKDHLTKKGDAEGDLCLAKSQERALDTALDAKNGHACDVDGQDFFHQGDEILIRRKKSGKKTGPQHGEDHIDEGRQEGDGDHSLDGHFHPVKFSRAEVVADDGLHAVGKTADRHENQLQNALENRHGTDIEVAPVGHDSSRS